MTAHAAPLTHIRLDDKGVPWIDETGFKVQFVVLEHLEWGWSAEEISYQHYGQVSVAQAHAALAYYHDNRCAMDEMIAANEADMERIRAEIGETDIQRKLLSRRAS